MNNVILRDYKQLDRLFLKNPLYHFTSARNAEQILKSGKIKTSNVFPGYTEDQDWNHLSNKNLPKSFSSLILTSGCVFFCHLIWFNKTSVDAISSEPLDSNCIWKST